jgi:hypothetical protein
MFVRALADFGTVLEELVLGRLLVVRVLLVDTGLVLLIEVLADTRAAHGDRLVAGPLGRSVLLVVIVGLIVLGASTDLRAILLEFFRGRALVRVRGLLERGTLLGGLAPAERAESLLRLGAATPLQDIGASLVANTSITFRD